METGLYKLPLRLWQPRQSYMELDLRYNQLEWVPCFGNSFSGIKIKGNPLRCQPPGSCWVKRPYARYSVDSDKCEHQTSHIEKGNPPCRLLDLVKDDDSSKIYCCNAIEKQPTETCLKKYSDHIDPDHYLSVKEHKLNTDTVDKNGNKGDKGKMVDRSSLSKTNTIRLNNTMEKKLEDFVYFIHNADEDIDNGFPSNAFHHSKTVKNVGTQKTVSMLLAIISMSIFVILFANTGCSEM